MTTDPRVVVYTTDHCAYCVRAKMLLDARGVAYREERLPADAEGRARLAAVHPDVRTFPLIVIDGAPIGGYRELVAYDREGQLTAIAT